MTSLKTKSSRLINALLWASLPLGLYAAETAAPSKNLADQVREATESGNLAQKRLSLIVNGKGGKASTPPADDKAKLTEPAPVVATQKPSAEKIIDLDVTVRAASAAKRPPADTKTTRQRPAPVVKAPAAKLTAAAHLRKRRHQTVTHSPNTAAIDSTTENKYGHQKSCI